MRIPLARAILPLVVAGLAACSKGSPTTPTPNPGPTRFTVFASDRGRTVGSFRNFVTGLDGSGTVEFVIGTAPGIVDRHPSITGDGNLLVYQSSPGRGGSQDVFGYNRGSGQLTDDSNVNTNANETDPYLSLDGRRLAFVRDTLGTRRIRLYDTQSQRLIPLAGLEGAPGSNDSAPALDELGQRLVFVSDRLGNPDVYLYNVATQSLSSFGSLISDSADVEPSISGDGRYICFASSRAGGMGGYDLFLFDRTTSQMVALSANSATSDRDPSISEDGRYIQFVSNRPGGLGGSDLWLHDRTGATVTQVGGQNSAATDIDPVVVWR